MGSRDVKPACRYGRMAFAALPTCRLFGRIPLAIPFSPPARLIHGHECGTLTDCNYTH